VGKKYLKASEKAASPETNQVTSSKIKKNADDLFIICNKVSGDFKIKFAPNT
jgi:hypothetical protein